MPLKLHCELKARMRRVLERHPEGISVSDICVRTHGRKSLVKELLRKVGAVAVRREGNRFFYAMDRDALERLHENTERGSWVPTPEELEQRKAAIRREWDETEYRRRAGVMASREWTPLQCRAHCAEPVEGDAA